MAKRAGKIAANKVSRRSRAKLSTCRSMRRRNSLGCSRVLCSKRLITNWRFSLPAKQASRRQASSRSGKGELTQYRITGLGFSPQSIWLDHDGDTAAVCRAGSRSCQLHSKRRYRSCKKPNKRRTTFGQSVSRTQLAHVPKGDLVIRNARLFDPRDLSVTPGTSVLVRGDRIVRVAPDADVKPSADAEIIDAQGRFLMPGLVGQSSAFQRHRWRARSG